MIGTDVGELEARLHELERDLAGRQNDYEAAARAWHEISREREYEYATAFMSAAGSTVTERKQQAVVAVGATGVREEAAYEALRSAIRVMELRSMILMSLLKAAGRA